VQSEAKRLTIFNIAISIRQLAFSKKKSKGKKRNYCENWQRIAACTDAFRGGAVAGLWVGGAKKKTTKKHKFEMRKTGL
jgi:hypothetical protein